MLRSRPTLLPAPNRATRVLTLALGVAGGALSAGCGGVDQVDPTEPAPRPTTPVAVGDTARPTTPSTSVAGVAWSGWADTARVDTLAVGDTVTRVAAALDPDARPVAGAAVAYAGAPAADAPAGAPPPVQVDAASGFARATALGAGVVRASAAGRAGPVSAEWKALVLPRVAAASMADVALAVGATARPALAVRDSTGAEIALRVAGALGPGVGAGVPVAFGTADPAVATVTADGTVSAEGAGTTTVTAALVQGRRSVFVSARVTVTAPVAATPPASSPTAPPASAAPSPQPAPTPPTSTPASPPGPAEPGPPAGSFRIDVRYVGTPDPAIADLVARAARSWESVIAAGGPTVAGLTLPAGECGRGTPALDETVPNVIVYVAIDSLDGPGGRAGTAGPCILRGEATAAGTRYGLPVVGYLGYDRDDLLPMVANGSAYEMLRHQLGHVLGVGTVWNLDGQRALVTDAYDYVGAEASAASAALGYTAAGAAALAENTGGAGTAGAHWRESVYGDELMTSYVGAGAAMTRVTVASLADIGYTVAVGAGEARPLATRAAARTRVLRAARAPGSTAGETVLAPRLVVSRRGVVSRAAR